jgi:hypothetical protein
MLNREKIEIAHVIMASMMFTGCIQVYLMPFVLIFLFNVCTHIKVNSLMMIFLSLSLLSLYSLFGMLLLLYRFIYRQIHSKLIRLFIIVMFYDVLPFLLFIFAYYLR